MSNTKEVNYLEEMENLRKSKQEMLSLIETFEEKERELSLKFVEQWPKSVSIRGLSIFLDHEIINQIDVQLRDASEELREYVLKDNRFNTNLTSQLSRLSLVFLVEKDGTFTAELVEEV